MGNFGQGVFEWTRLPHIIHYDSSPVPTIEIIEPIWQKGGVALYWDYLAEVKEIDTKAILKGMVEND